MPVGPYSQDVLTRIINVNWGGLAVEFTEEPSYLTLEALLSMNKVVISVWFRVPSKSAEAAPSGEFWDYQVFNGVIPVITWGAQQTTPVTHVEMYDTGKIDESAGAIMLERISGSHKAPLQPSCIGVYVPFAGSVDKPSLHVHIQTNVQATGTGLAQIRTDFTGDFVGTDVHTGKPVYSNIKYITTDVSDIITEEPEYLGNIDLSGAGYPKVELDEWNHLLISWELIGGYTNKMWCAINDVNKNGFDLPAMNEVTFGMGPNDHTSHTLNIYQAHEGASVDVSFGIDGVVPSDPLQTPGPPSVSRASNDAGGTTVIAPIAMVELAELQIFGGITLDTSVTANRRAFIDFERDELGVPIKDEDGKMTLKPVDPEEAEGLLGKKPEILLHGSGNWQEGNNTGSLGVDTEGESIPSGQFKPTGTINVYKPDPSRTA